MDEITPLLVSISTQVGEVNGKLDGLKTAMDLHLAADTKSFDEIKDRVTVLEDRSSSNKGSIRTIKWLASGLASAGVLDAIIRIFK